MTAEPRHLPDLADPSAVRSHLARDRSTRGARRAAARRAEAEGQDRALRREQVEQWYTRSARPAFVALARLQEPFTSDDVHALLEEPPPSTGALGACFTKARGEQLICRAPGASARSSMPAAHRRPVGVWLGASVGAQVEGGES